MVVVTSALYFLLTLSQSTQVSQHPQPKAAAKAKPTVRSNSTLDVTPALPLLDLKKFALTKRAVAAIAGATEVGVNYRAYQALVQDLATELRLAIQ